MATDHRARIAGIRRFDQLVAYLRDDMGWPIESADFEDLTFDYTPEELGIDAKNAAKIQEIKRLRPLAPGQPWGIFFVKFEPKRLPVVALRRILSQVALKKRASANKSEQQAWAADDLLFISNYGEDGERRIAFAHFAKPIDKSDLPTLKVLGWDNLDTPLHLDDVADKLVHHLSWPEDPSDEKRWRARWRGAFVLRHGEVVSTSRDLSVRLAGLARAIRDRINTAIAIETDKGPLTKLMKAFQSSLVHDLTTEGFADMYAQTIAYGLLSSRIADPQKKTADDFAAHMRTNPFLRELMETFLKVGGRKGKKGGAGIDFDELGVSEVVELLDHANMEAIIRDFGDRNPEEDPVIHFYELFLEQYDAEKRMQRGVFYTPRPVVSYIVRAVDELLRTEFGLEDGLADTTTWGELVKRHQGLKIPDGVSPDQDFVQIIDPATGTGTFLVEVIDLIHKNLVAKWKQQGYDGDNIVDRWNVYVIRHLLSRLHGYELLMAPYAIAHLKIGLKLFETGYRFSSDERARVYLTNALEGEQDFADRFEFAIPSLAREAEAVNTVKSHRRFTVVLGNPPYSGVSSNMSEEAQSLVDSYKFVDGTPLKEKKLWLQDDYVKFIRKAQLDIDAAGAGIVGLITNHSYLSNPTFRGMRQSLMKTFSCFRVVDLHGNTKRPECVPHGLIDKNVFDIQQGVAVCLASVGGLQRGVKRYDLWGSRDTKYSWLMNHGATNIPLKTLDPDSPYYFFEPLNTDYRTEYEAGWKLNELMPVNSAGFITARDHFVVDFDSEVLLARIGEFAAPDQSDEAIRRAFFQGCGSAKYPDGDTRGWKLSEARHRIAHDKKWRERVRECNYRPFDTRYIYWAEWMVDWTRPEVSAHLLAGPNIAFHVCRQSISDDWAHVFVVKGLVDDCCVSNKSRERGYAHPLYLYDSGNDLVFGDSPKPNFSPQFLARLANALKMPQVRSHAMPEGLEPEDVFHYVYALLHCPTYRRRYAGLLKIDFPRVPLTEYPELFKSLACLGEQLVALHLLESDRLEQSITEYQGDHSVEVDKVSWCEEVVWLDKKQTAGFRGIPEGVWTFRIGGYQVCEKWLKDRKGRTLLPKDIKHYQKIVSAISETIGLMKQIDEVVDQHGGWPGAFQPKDVPRNPAKVIPFRPRPIQPTPKERFRTCVPLIPLKAAAGAFSAPQHIDDDSFEWVKVDTSHRLREGMFVSQVVGRSMEPMIPDGSYCLFRAPVEGSRQGKTVLVQLRDITDPETSQRFTVKRYKSDKVADGDSWCHEKITLEPLNPDFEAIVLTDGEQASVQVIAELVEVLSEESD